eukprot:s3229_g10.t1
MQLENGVSWTDVLERQLAMVKRALKRDVGPECRAKEVNPEGIPTSSWEARCLERGKPVRATWSYGWAVVWMLRCVELVHMKVSDLKLDFHTKMVTVCIRKSKTDQAALGVKRTLKCCGAEVCTRLCPWGLAVRILADLPNARDTTPLFPDHKGMSVQKVKMIKSWIEQVDDGVTGHSGRRSGAMWYARRGMPIHEIGMLGRWKSSAVFRYIEEALQDIPLNSNVAGDRAVLQRINPGTPVPTTNLSDPSTCSSGAREVKSHEAQEVMEGIKPPKKPQKPAVPDQCWAVSVGRNGKISHRVRRASWNLSLASWDTWCGWHFAEKNVKVTLTPKFLATTKKCKKCESAHQSRDVVKEEVSLAQLVNFDQLQTCASKPMPTRFLGSPLLGSQRLAHTASDSPLRGAAKSQKLRVHAKSQKVTKFNMDVDDMDGSGPLRQTRQSPVGGPKAGNAGAGNPTTYTMDDDDAVEASAPAPIPRKGGPKAGNAGAGNPTTYTMDDDDAVEASAPAPIPRKGGPTARNGGNVMTFTMDDGDDDIPEATAGPGRQGSNGGPEDVVRGGSSGDSFGAQRISHALSGESPKAYSTEPEEVIRDDAPELPGAVGNGPRTPSLALSLRGGGSIRLKGGTSKTPSLAISVRGGGSMQLSEKVDDNQAVLCD